MDSKLVKTQMDYLVGNFKKNICQIFDISEEEFTLFIQANIQGNYYLGVNGNLNDLVLSQKDNDAHFSAMSVEAPVSKVKFQIDASVIPSPVLNGDENPCIEFPDVGEDDFLLFMEKEIGHSDNSESTRLNQLSTLKNLREFRSSISFTDLDYELLYNFKMFMTEKGLAPNTIAKHFKHIKRYVNIAINKERMFHYPFRNFKIHQVETHKTSLNLKEIEAIEKYREEHPEHTEFGEMIDSFLFSCYTGMRYSDICRLTMQHFQTINRKRWIVMPTRKTGTIIRIPLYLMFEGKGLGIVSKYHRRRASIFRLPSNNKVNRLLAILMGYLGIRKHITFHSARHTNATLLLYKGVSITTVQKLLGHKDIKTTQVYSAVTDMTLVKELKEAKKRGRRRLI